jgi:hypothetical protein
MTKGVLDELEYQSDRESSRELIQRALNGDEKAKQELRELHLTYWEHEGEVLLPRKVNNGQR